MTTTTHTVHLQPELERAIKDLGFTELTEIQQKALPLIQQGKDVFGQSHTGSGKTAAFGLPIIGKTIRGKGVQALIVVPTRELCDQVAQALRTFSKYKPLHIIEVYGGVSITPQISNLRHADIVVATPGRLLDHLERRTINLNSVNTLVLDEADKMLDMGFINDIEDIIRIIPKERQTLLFSATLSKDIEHIARKHMKNPETVNVQEYVDTTKLTQQYYEIDQRDKYSLLVHLLHEHREGLTIVFCGTKRMVDALATNLNNAGINARALHGGISQHQRSQALNALHTHHTNILIASDIAARGIDVKNLALVINYDIPKTSKDYVHRIGRTARAGEEGKVVSLLTDRDHENFRAVLRDRSLHIQREELPAFTRVPFLARPQSRGREGGGSGQGGWQRRGPPTRSGGRFGGGNRGPFRGRQGQSRENNRGRNNYRQGREQQRREA